MSVVQTFRRCSPLGVGKVVQWPIDAYTPQLHHGITRNSARWL